MKNLNQSQKGPWQVLLLLLVHLLSINIGFSKPKPLLSNGAIAYAYPLNGITIDGDMADWAKVNKSHPIKEVPFGNLSQGPHDLSAYFKVGYNLVNQSLYILVVVTDDSHMVTDSKKATWNSQDTYMLYVDAQHSPKGSGLLLYEISEHRQSMIDPSESWDPSVRDATMKNIKFAFRRQGNQSIYEGQVKLGEQLKVGKSIGIDHLITDRDHAEKEMVSYVTWGKGGAKSRAPGRLGDIMLMKPGQAMGKVKGKVAWKKLKVKEVTNRLRLTSTSNPALWTQVVVEKDGSYAAQLPVGNYKISLVWRFFYDKQKSYRMNDINQTTQVKANKTTEVPLIQLTTSPKIDLIPKKGILPDFDAKKALALDKFIKTYQKYYEVPGVSLALIKKGKVIYHKTYGVKNSLTGAKVDKRTLFEAASVTKPVFGFVVCRLAERGIIDLDKPLYQYLPFENIAHDKRYKLITARHVLSHRTGFPNWAYNNSDGKIDIKFTPGTKFGYSGEGFEYLKRVVAKITGKDISTVLKEEILTPLGLKNTYFMKNEYLAKVVSNGHYDHYPTRAVLPDSPGMAWSMHTEAKSFATFALALRNKKGLKPATYKEMFRIHTEIPKGKNDKTPEIQNYFGLGIALEKTPLGTSFGHGGNNGDFKCQFKMYEDLDVGFIIFTNSDNGDRLHRAVEKYLITGKIRSNKK